MPRNSSGTYTLPAGNPVVTDTLIQTAWANPTMSDLASSLTDSLDRNGRGGMLAPFKIDDGTLSAPGLAFTSQANLGLYRDTTDTLGIGSGGVAVAKFSSAAITLLKPLTLTGDLTLTGNQTVSGTLKMGDGTVAAPTLAFTSEAGLGWYRPGAGAIAIAAAGLRIAGLDASITTNTNEAVYPRLTAGQSSFSAYAFPYLNASKNNITMGANSAGGALTSFTADGIAKAPLDITGSVVNINVGSSLAKFDSAGTLTTKKLTLDTPGGGQLWLDAVGDFRFWQNPGATNADYKYLAYAPTWYWAWNKATGDLVWVRDTSTIPNPQTVFYANGDVTLNAGVFSAYQLKPSKYDVSGPLIYTNFLVATPGGAGPVVLSFQGVNGGTLAQFQCGVAGRFTFYEDGTAAKNGAVTTWSVGSDRRLKQDIEDYTDGLDQVLAIRPRRFKYTNAPERECVGIVGDEMKDALPRTIGTDMEGFDTFTLDPVIWALVNSVKTMAGFIEDVEVRLANIEGAI